MTVIDAHAHIVPPEIVADRSSLCERDAWFGRLYGNPRAPLASVEELIASLDAGQIDRAVAFGFAFADAGLCHLCNDYVLDAANRYAGRTLPFAVVNPLSAGAVAEAERCLAAGARGVGELLPDGQGFALATSDLDPLLGLLREARAPLLLHVNEPVGHEYPGKGRHGPAEAYALAARHPENDIIVAHWGGGLPFYELMPEVKTALARVWYDTSASSLLYDDSVYRFVAEWAADKVLFGSDFPLVSPGRAVRRVRRLRLGQEVTSHVLGGNAARLLRIEEMEV
jgi:hypothetical protein